jgi:hypothetical protein
MGIGQAIDIVKAGDQTHAHYTEAVLFVLEHTSGLVEQIITPKSIDLVANQGITPVRAAIFNVFERTRRLLGRDSEAVILEDTSEYFRRLSNEIDLTSCVTVRGRNGTNPFIWVKENIVRFLDADMHNLVVPTEDEHGGWYVRHVKPFLHLQEALYFRLSSRNSRKKWIFKKKAFFNLNHKIIVI